MKWVCFDWKKEDKTLDSIQYLVSLVVNKEIHPPYVSILHWIQKIIDKEEKKH